MIIHDFIWPLVIVSLPTAIDVQLTSFSKLDYTIPYNDCQTEPNKDTMNHNFIKTKDYIENNHKKYQDIFP
jgi:hypothetical protein